MARWYARFDNTSEAALDNTNATEGYFTKLRISAGSASAALLRDGLIASKSALSTDVYADLDSVNINGANGTYFPNDDPNKTINSVTPPTYISWSNGYSSTLQGIKTPTTNVYGVADSINYSKRPTESVSYNSAWLTALSPADSIGASYSTYYSASAAVKAIVDVIQTSSGTATTPYIRQGDTPARTILSLWSNPGTDYFAWDDFTPGLWDQSQILQTFPVATGCPPTASLGNPVSIDAEFVVDVFAVGAEYPNDKNIGAKIGFTIEIRESGSNIGTPVAVLQLGGQYDTTDCADCGGTPLLIGDYRTGTGPVGNRGSSNSTWQWNTPGPTVNYQLKWTVPLTAGEYNLKSWGKLHDAVITTHVKTAGRQNFAGQSCASYGDFMVAAGEAT